MTSHALPRAARRAVSPFTLDRIARAGYVAHGVVYMLVGALAVLAAVHAGGALAGPREALSIFGDGPAGRIVVALLAIGLAAYAAWSFAQATLDADRKGSSKKAIAKRVGRFVTGVIYAATAVFAARVAIGAGRAASGDETPGVVARVMALPFGTLIVVAAGVVFLVLAGVQVKKVVTKSFMKELEVYDDPKVRRAVRNITAIGRAARAVVFTIVGVFLIIAAINHDPSQARGLEGALATLAARPYGTLLLAVTAAGLFAYGLSELARARYRRHVAAPA